MTAFARRDMKETWGTATWELRSVNQRYLETNISLPEQFRRLEPIIRHRVRAFLARGKVECNLCVNVNQQSTLILNHKLSNKLIQAAQWVKRQSNEGEIDPLAILRWPGVIAVTEQDQDIDADIMSAELLSGLDATLHDLINVRETEGIALQIMIEQRLAGVSAEVSKIRQHMPEILAWQKNKLLNKFEEAQIRLDNHRQEQELVMLAQRMDVAEELERLEAHIKETYHILRNKEVVGRRLDFMMQEFARESNTLASKSINTSVTASAIELKVLIEQMREQIQNIE